MSTITFNINSSVGEEVKYVIAGAGDIVGGDVKGVSGKVTLNPTATASGSYTFAVALYDSTLFLSKNATTMTVQCKLNGTTWTYVGSTPDPFEQYRGWQVTASSAAGGISLKVTPRAAIKPTKMVNVTFKIGEYPKDSGFTKTSMRYLVSGMGSTAWIDTEPSFWTILPLTLPLPATEKGGTFDINVIMCAHQKGDKSVFYAFNGSVSLVFDLEKQTYTATKLNLDPYAHNLPVALSPNMPANTIEINILQAA